jgi:hypothetical protein
MHALTVVQFASYFECKIHCPHGTKICVEDGKRDDAYIVLLCGQSLREMTIVGIVPKFISNQPITVMPLYFSNQIQQHSDVLICQLLNSLL